MPNHFTILSSIAELEHALEGSAVRPLVIFKHSPTCGTSAQAFESISDWLEGIALEVDFFLVPVQASRTVSTDLAQRFGIRHESPQAIVIADGRVVWHGSHYRATPTAISAALDKLVAATSARE